MDNIQIIENILESSSNFFITGKAGTGKSTLIRYCIDYFEKNNINTVVLAPTWLSAIHVWWVTIHSFFRFSPGLIPQKAAELWDIAHNTDIIYQKISIIIIDEISMVRADLLDCIDIFLRKARGVDTPFWGVKMIFVWDLYQLSPIVQHKETEFKNKYESPYFFSSYVFSTPWFDVEIIHLTQVYRQTDEKFIQVLNSIRLWNVTSDDINYLNHARLHPKTDTHIILTPTNKEKNAINKEELEKLNSKSFTSYIEISWNVSLDDVHLEKILTLKEGARVMFIQNAIDKSYVNGTLGTIKKITDGIIDIQTDEEKYVQITKLSGEEIIFEYVYDHNVWKIKKRVQWKFIQYPISLAWAVTMHKSQWHSYKHVAISFWKSWCFAYGQAYVALSRCKSFEWMHFINDLTRSSILTNDAINQFYKTRINNKQKLDFTHIGIKIEDWRIETMFRYKWWLSYFDVAVSIIEKIHKEGGKAFIVWGFCRNRILWLEDQTDIDISTDFIPENIQKYFNVVNTIWEKFWVLIIKEFWYIYEISTFRKDISKHHVRFIKKFSEDANRRDFTINAIYLDPISDTYKIFNNPVWIQKNSLQDGRVDLKNKIIRFIGKPHNRIQEDPLRLLRYVRCKTAYNLSDAYEEQYDIVKQNFHLLQDIPFERIKVEIEKIFSWSGTIQALEMLKELWFFKIFIPEIDDLDTCPWWPKYHLEWNVWIHTLNIIKILKKNMVTHPDMYWIALFHDTWKRDTYRKKQDGSVSYIWHETLSDQIFHTYSKKLFFTTHQIKKISWIIQKHMLFWNITQMKALKVRKLFLHSYWHEFYIFCSADCLWKTPRDENYPIQVDTMYQEFMKKFQNITLFTWEDVMQKYPHLHWREIWVRLKELNNTIIANI